VALIEQQTEEDYAAMGAESMAINSDLLRERGVPDMDPVEYYQNWMAVAQDYPNPTLIMKFCKNVGTHSDWYYGLISEEDKKTMTTNWWPGPGGYPHMLKQIGPFKFWPGVASFYGECGQTKIHGYNRAAAERSGAVSYFETEAQYLVMNNGSVAGVVATSPEGNVKFNCKAVVIATGGFGDNTDMIKDLMPDIWNALTPDEEWSAMGFGAPLRFGRGIQMAYWAGAHLETVPIPGMNSKHIQPPGSDFHNLPQAVWIDSRDGKRYCNEFYPIVEHRGQQPLYRKRQTTVCVFDDDFATYRQYIVPQHGGFDPTEENIQSLKDAMSKAKAVFDGTWVEPEASEGESGEGGMMMGGAAEYICDDTLEGLAKQLGFSDEATRNFVAEINAYNTYCTNGVDEDFGRYSEVLFPCKKAPFYACADTTVAGRTMCTMGGIITDGEQNALDLDYNPIPGLYVSGNDCGRRWGLEYFTPTPGVSIATCVTLGRECGKSVAKWLKG
jgi:hypothetical protein